MTSIEIAALIITLAAGFGYINARVFRLPSAIGLMAMALLGSFVIVGLGAAGVVDVSRVQGFVARADFAYVLMHGMLGLLLFAGALHVDVTHLAEHKWSISALALGGTLLSTAIVGFATNIVMRALGQDIGLANSLLFGALISPTDPIAVLGILKSAKAPEALAVQIGGESLFNDGVGVVIFLVIRAASEGGHVTVGGVAALFAREAIGGAVFGFALGYIGFQLLRRINDYSVEVLITLAMVVGGYAAAERIHVSAPIAAVIAGLVVGNDGRRLAMSDV
ncbi:MAG: cation:proton antiporter, partial [Byssovorax sp.]